MAPRLSPIATIFLTAARTLSLKEPAIDIDGKLLRPLRDLEFAPEADFVRKAFTYNDLIGEVPFVMSSSWKMRWRFVSEVDKEIALEELRQARWLLPSDYGGFLYNHHSVARSADDGSDLRDN